MTNSNKPALIAIFDDRLAAERAVDDLMQAGFTADEVGYVLRGDDVAHGGMLSDATGAKDKKGAVTGAITGAVAGGLAAAAVTMLIPGVGPVLAAGALATAVGYAGAGAAVGGIVGALSGLGVSEHEAKFYEQHFNEGKAIVAVHAGAREMEARAILHQRGGYHLQDRVDDPVKTTGVFSEP